MSSPVVLFAQGPRLVRLAIALGTFAALMIAAVVAMGVFLPAPTLPGTPLGDTLAPTFRLSDYRGVGFDLASQRGRPVVLTFLFSTCPDVCRLTAAGVRQTVELLGESARAVAFVAVTVDPDGDDAGSVRRFLTRQGVAERLIYLTGPPEALPAVWQSYFLYVDSSAGLQREARLNAHTDAMFVIDKRGRERTLLRSDFDPAELAAALRLLLREAA